MNLIGWLKKFLCLCDHKWIIEKIIYVYESNFPESLRLLKEENGLIRRMTKKEMIENEPPNHHFYVLKCEKCGNLRKKIF
jgi:hypothetical protein